MYRTRLNLAFAYDCNLFNLILETAGLSLKFAFWHGGCGKHSCPRSTMAIHSMAGSRTHDPDFLTTALSPLQFLS